MREVQSVFPGRMVHVYYVTIGERFEHFFLLRDEVLLCRYIVYLFGCPSPPHCVTSLCLTAGTLYNVYVLRITHTFTTSYFFRFNVRFSSPYLFVCFNSSQNKTPAKPYTHVFACRLLSLPHARVNNMYILRLLLL